MIDLGALEHALTQEPEAAHLVDRDLLAALVRAVRAALTYRDTDPANCAYCGGNETSGGHERWCNVESEQDGVALDAALAPFRPEQT